MSQCSAKGPTPVYSSVRFFFFLFPYIEMKMKINETDPHWFAAAS